MSGDLDTSGVSIHAQPQLLVYRSLQPQSSDGMELDNMHVRRSTVEPSVESLGEDEDEDAAKEYVVEAIINHYRNAGKKLYLVMWEGHKDSHDWLLEEDLEGAAELVAEYNASVRKRKGKQKLNR
jgi:hypothetical protein